MSIETIAIEGFFGKPPAQPSEKFQDLASFSVGVTQSIKSKNTEEWEYKTTWYKCNSRIKINQIIYLRH
jgi:hypothetical protein